MLTPRLGASRLITRCRCVDGPSERSNDRRLHTSSGERSLGARGEACWNRGEKSAFGLRVGQYELNGPRQPLGEAYVSVSTHAERLLVPSLSLPG
jgi:hypothetical protein